jgi:CubicO group peptidase (beta-lactamase class C family)
VVLIGPSKVVSSGLARTAADPPKLAMGPDVMVNVLSVGKMFTTIAVLQSLARHHRSTGSRIWPFLPPDWVKGPGVGTITFGELLTHRAGFRLDSGLVFKIDDASREQIRQGIQQIDKQVADYNNINFTIFRDMLPFMEGAPQPGPAARAAAADRFFLTYMQRQVFDPVGVTDATCAPVRHAMLMYPAARHRDGTGEAGPGAAIGVLGGRLVHDRGQHATGTSGPDQRQPAVHQPTAADGPQLSGLGLLHHQPGQLPGQDRRPFLRRLSVPADLLRHPRRDDPRGDSHQLRPRETPLCHRANRPACRHQRPVADK